MRLFLVSIMLLAAACDNSVPPAPPIVINITAVKDTTALANAVEQALTGTALNSVALTETQYAREGITLTPTLTATATATPPAPSATAPLPPSATYTPSTTPTATFAVYPTNVIVAEAPAGSQDTARLRVLNAWVDYRPESDERVDVYINDMRVAHAMEVQQTTAYQRVSAGAARVSVYLSQDDPAAQLAAPPLISQTVNLSPGGSMSLVIADVGQGLTLVPVTEDATPLASGMSRITLLHANPALLELNVLLPDTRRVLAVNLQSAGVAGPVDLPRDNYLLQLYDSFTPELLLTEISGLNLTGQVNHLLVFVPASPDSLALTDYLLFTGSTDLIETDVNVRFINAASEVGSLSFSWEDRVQIPRLAVGAASVAVPLSGLGTVVEVNNLQGNEVGEIQLGPWTTAGERTDKLVVILDPNDNAAPVVGSATFSQDAIASPIRANLRLINALPDTLPLALQASLPASLQLDPNEAAWEVLVANVRYGESSDYGGRAPGIYDVRVVLTGTNTEIARLPQLQLLAGGAYQFIVVPGTEPGSANLLLMQPEVQIGLASAQGLEAIPEIVNATLTALAPASVDTATPVRTATPTVTPVPTNTAYPTNTPSVRPPTLFIDPLPPNAASRTFTLVGVNFAAGKRYSIRLDNSPELQSGRVGQDGSLLVVVNLPINITPGPHIVQLCVDCGPGGLQQAEFAIVVVADPNATATPTPNL